MLCLNTSSKTIILDDNIYCDWDEIHEEKYNVYEIDKKRIHSTTDGGFFGDTEISLENGVKKIISNIQIGDILENGEVVNGLVEIYGKDLYQYKFSIENRNVDVGNNIFYIINGEIISSLNDNTKLSVERKNKENNKKETILYHLITNTKTFFIANVEYLDYDYCIEYLVKK